MSSLQTHVEGLPLVRYWQKLTFTDLFSLILDMVVTIRKYVCTRPFGPYEILDYDAQLELLDTAGKRDRFRKQQRVKFLQDNIIAIEDYAWGDGDVLTDYRCTPGAVVDTYREGDRWNILISLRTTKSAGDVQQFYMEQKGRNTYRKADEWLQTEVRHHMRRLRMSVVFPRQRHCRGAALVQRRANRSQELGPNHLSRLPDGRQILSWETTHARAYEVYTLKWKW